MPIQIHQGDGPITVVDVSGKLQSSDYDHFRTEFEHLAAVRESLRILFDMRNFEGWEVSALWSEMKFDAKHFSRIDRLAAVGDKTWEKGLIKFAKPFTSAELHYFNKEQQGEAERWHAQT